MGMSMTVAGYMPADERWKKMKAAWDACAAAGIQPPQEVGEFFGWEDPKDTPGKEVELGASVREWKNDYADGYEVDITSLPDGVKFIRFYCSW